MKRKWDTLVAGLCTAFFYILNAPFFSVLLQNATFFCILILSFWRLMKPIRTQRTQRSFANNVKERKNVWFFCKRTQNFAFFFSIYI